MLVKADRTWNDLLAGRKREKVLLFAEGDALRIREARRAGASKRYE